MVYKNIDQAFEVQFLRQRLVNKNNKSYGQQQVLEMLRFTQSMMEE